MNMKMIGENFVMKKKNKKENTANEFINVADIKDNVLYTKDDKVIKFIKIEAISISTMSKTDIKIFLRTLASEFSSYEGNLRFFKISKPIDISKLILDYKEMYRITVDIKQKELLRGATLHLQRYSSGNQLENNHYIIIKNDSKNIQELEDKTNDIRRRFSNAKILAEICDTTEIIRLCNLFANPNYSNVENIENDISIIRDFVGGGIHD